MGEGRHRWGWGQLEPEPRQCWGAGGERPGFIDSLFLLCCKLPELLQNHLIIFLFSRPFCIVCMFFIMSLCSFENLKKQLSHFHLRGFSPL